MKIAIGLFAAWAAVSFAHSSWAQDRDGLNHELRNALYTESTAFVATVQLRGLTGGAIGETLRGLFDSSSRQIVSKEQPGWETNAMAQVTALTTVASALVKAEYESATVVGLDHQGRKVFGVLYLTEFLRGKLFVGAKKALQVIADAQKVKIDAVDVDDRAVIYPLGIGLPDPALGYSASVEQAVQAGLGQPRGTPAVSVVIPTSNAIRALLLSTPGAASEFTTALGDATYVGGYLITGERPELHLYARFSGETKAEAVKKIYDAGWAKQMETAKTADEQHADDIKEGRVHTVWYITWTEMYSRIRAASSLKVFGGVVLLDLDTPALHEITGALVDGFVRKPAP